MNPKTTVMLVDDHAVVRSGYRLFLSQTGNIEVVYEAASGEEACRLYQEYRPAVTVMDLNLPGIGGLEAVRHIIARAPAARILMFSIHDDLAHVARSQEAGAMGYITKSCAPEMLVEAVLKVAQGERYLEPKLAQALAARPFASNIGPTVLGELSPHELDIFCLLAKGLNVREVADELRLAYKTVWNRTTLLKSKLNARSTAEMVHIAHEYGLSGN